MAHTACASAGFSTIRAAEASTRFTTHSVIHPSAPPVTQCTTLFAATRSSTFHTAIYATFHPALRFAHRASLHASFCPTIRASLQSSVHATVCASLRFSEHASLRSTARSAFGAAVSTASLGFVRQSNIGAAIATFISFSLAFRTILKTALCAFVRAIVHIAGREPSSSAFCSYVLVAFHAA
jgi:hypothetical protein